MLEVWREGDGDGHPFAFPKCDFHINEDTYTDPSQRALLEFATEVASENGAVYFVFDRDDGAVLSQCCRLRQRVEDIYMIQHPESMRFCGFQNVTINLPQAAYRAKKGDLSSLYSEIAKAIDLAIKAHLQKKQFILDIMAEPGLPMWEVGKIAFDGRPYIDLDKATYIIGLIGLNECMQHFIGRQLHEDDEVFKLGLKVISFMYSYIKEKEKECRLKLSLEESPAESATRRLARVDLDQYSCAKDVVKGNIEKDQGYYTNSIHFAADAPIDLITRIQKQSKFHPMIESGAIIHAFVGEHRPHPQSIFKLVEHTFRKTQAAQLVISPEFTICEDCRKMTAGLKDRCSFCGSKAVYGVTRIVGYYSRISNWNKSKLAELEDRHRGDYKVY
jgi:ribonucleoside-triphosphate reductase